MESRTAGQAPRQLHAGWLIAAAVLWPGLRDPRAQETILPQAPTPPIQNNSATEEDPPLRNKDDRPYWRKNLFVRVFSDQKFLVTEWWPDEFRRPGFTAPLLGATMVAASSRSPGEHAYDFRIGGTIDERSAGSSDRIAGEFTRVGNGPVFAAMLGTTYLISRWSGNDKLAETSSLSVEAMIDAGIWIEVLKRTFARIRPNQAGEGAFFQYGAPENSSFPSGHAMGTFTVATVFAEQYGDKRWVPWVAYGTAGLISMSRIALGRHFPSDVLVGAILGNSIGRAVVARQRGDDLDRRWTERLAPIVSPDGTGLGVAYTYAW